MQPRVGRRAAAGEKMDQNKVGVKAPQPPNGQFWRWWLVALVVLVIWNVASLLVTGVSTSIGLSYTAFLAQVRAGNVARVNVSGDELTGTFVKPYKPPQSSPAPAPAPTAYTAFRTTFPASLGDSSLLPLLERERVQIDVTPAPSPWVSSLVSWLPMLALLAFFVWSARRAAAGPMGALTFGRAKPKRYTADRPKVTFNDVAGVEEAKIELQEEVDFLRHPAKYHQIGARIPKGVLLAGPPGTGKTLLARAVAGEASVPFFSLSASEFVEMFVGVGASRVRDLFQQAKESAPAIVFIDEIDAVGRRRGAGLGTVNDEREQTLNQLLAELDGFDPRENIIVLAATNRPDVLDPALLRPGRFDRQVTIPLPDRAGREGILKIHTRKLRLAAEVDLAKLAAASIGMSGADLENLCNEAALGAARSGRMEITMTDFEEALDRVRLGVAHPRLSEPEEMRIVAYHEAGHTIVAWLSPHADPVQKVTVVPHGMALGATEQLPAVERHNLGERYLKTRLAVMLGGRAAEELVFAEPTTGAEQDLIQATSLARRMVTTWGMSDDVGLLAFKSDEQHPFLGYELAQGRDYSEATAQRIDAAVKRLLDEEHGEARRILAGARPQLDALVERLCKEETVSAPDLAEILGPREQKAPTLIESRTLGESSGVADEVAPRA
jgi:cell division protease FtsH